MRKKLWLQDHVVLTSTQEHEEALEKDDDEPGRAGYTNDSASSEEDTVSSDSENQTATKQHSKEVGYGGNAEQTDAKNNNEVEEQDKSDLTAALRK